MHFYLTGRIHLITYFYRLAPTTKLMLDVSITIEPLSLPNLDCSSDYSTRGFTPLCVTIPYQVVSKSHVYMVVAIKKYYCHL